jgi:hypothetical protein
MLIGVDTDIDNLASSLYFWYIVTMKFGMFKWGVLIAAPCAEAGQPEAAGDTLSLDKLGKQYILDG